MPLVIVDRRDGPLDVSACELTRPSLVLTGNETVGLSAACNDLLRIPIAVRPSRSTLR